MASKTTLRRRSIDMGMGAKDSPTNDERDAAVEGQTRGPNGKIRRRSTLDMMKADSDVSWNDTISVIQHQPAGMDAVNIDSSRRGYSVMLLSFGVFCLFAIGLFFMDTSDPPYDHKEVPIDHRDLNLFNHGKESSTPCPYAKEFANFLQGGDKMLREILNEGKGCWGHCDRVAGDCDYCGTGQCCRKIDYDNGVEGCELAKDVIGARCGNFRGEAEKGLRNEGKACRGNCGGQSGDCDFCGTGQCCRQVDGTSGVEGCELVSKANWEDGPA